MATNETYNGWTNYETWAYALWMTNDEGSYNYVQEMVSDALRDAGISDIAHHDRDEHIRTAVYELAELLKDDLDEAITEGLISKNMRNDIGSVWRIDFYEVADSWVTDYIADVEYEARNA